MDRRTRSVATFASGIVLNARSLRLSLAAIVLTVAASLAPVSAQASFIYDLTVSGNFTGSGSITFDNLSGTDTVFNDIVGVTAFSFHVDSGHGSGFGAPQDYELADLASVIWAIEPSSFDLTMELATVLIPFGEFQSAIFLVNDGFDPPLACASKDVGSSYTCQTFADGGGDGDLGNFTATRVGAVPEPASIALFAAGLAGLGWMSRRRKAM